MQTSDALLTIEGLKTHFFLEEGVVRAVDGVDLKVPRGKTVCVVGESGCGKSITARSVLGLVDPPGRVVDGRIWWQRGGSHQLSGVESGAEVVASAHSGDTPPVDLAAMDNRSEELRQIRGNEISMVFQEPMASLSPMYTVADHLIEVIRLHLDMSKQEAWDRGIELLQRVGIPRADQRMDSYPFQLSGGMCQRVMIALALAAGPSLLIADEPSTALDVTTQARIIDLLTELQADTGMSMLFITHDLGVVAEVADEVVVMYLGTVAEQGGVDEIFHDPKHPYTKALLESIPRMGIGTRERMKSIRGQVPHPLNRPKGCPYHPRCDFYIEGLCETVDPPMVELGNDRRARCVLYDSELMREHEQSTQQQGTTQQGETTSTEATTADPETDGEDA